MTEIDPVSEALCSLEYESIEEVQKLINPKSYTAPSKLSKLAEL
jgi:hypothetical protein